MSYRGSRKGSYGNQRKIYHVQIKHKNTGWRIASQHYTKKTAEKQADSWRRDIAKWKDAHPDKIRVVSVKRKTHGLAKITRSGRVIGYS